MKKAKPELDLIDSCSLDVGCNVFEQYSSLRKTLENVKGEFESFGEMLSVRETGTELLFQR